MHYLDFWDSQRTLFISLVNGNWYHHLSQNRMEGSPAYEIVDLVCMSEQTNPIAARGLA